MAEMQNPPGFYKSANQRDQVLKGPVGRQVQESNPVVQHDDDDKSRLRQVPADHGNRPLPVQGVEQVDGGVDPLELGQTCPTSSSLI